MSLSLYVLQKLSYAKTKSDAVAKLEGTYKPDKERSKKNAAARGMTGATDFRAAPLEK
jgi:hypothetical protein